MGRNVTVLRGLSGFKACGPGRLAQQWNGWLGRHREAYIPDYDHQGGIGRHIYQVIHHPGILGSITRVYTPLGIQGGITRVNTPWGIPWCIYGSHPNPEVYPGVYTPPSHTREVYPGVYTPPYRTREVYPGVYVPLPYPRGVPGCYSQGCNPRGVPGCYSRFVTREVYPGVIPVSLLVDSSCLLTTRFTVGRQLMSLMTTRFTVGLAEEISHDHPFHCWARRREAGIPPYYPGR